MNNLFDGCSSLESIDLTSFDTSRTEDMSFLFNNCTSLETIDMIFDTSNVESMESMFSNCENIKTLDLSSFSTEKCSNFDNIFENCGVEKVIIDKDKNKELIKKIPDGVEIGK